MLCENCGNPAGEGDRFCKNCGSSFVLAQSPSVLPDNAEKPNNKRVVFIVIGAISALVVFLAVLFGIMFYSKSKNTETTSLEFLEGDIEFDGDYGLYLEDCADANSSSRRYKHFSGDAYSKVMDFLKQKKLVKFSFFRISSPTVTVVNGNPSLIIDFSEIKEVFGDCNEKLSETDAILKEFIYNLRNGKRKAALGLMVSDPDEKVLSFINQARPEDLKVLAGNFEKGVIIEDTPDLKLYETHPIDNEGKERTAKFKLLKNQEGQWRIEMN